MQLLNRCETPVDVDVNILANAWQPLIKDVFYNIPGFIQNTI